LGGFGDARSIPEFMAMVTMEIQAYRTLRKYGMLASGDRVIVAVSGGADSTALLLCLNKLAPHLNLSLNAAHLNHHIRGPEADADEDFVRRMCADLGIPFVSETIEVKHQAAETRQNLEEMARRLRYDFLRRVASREKAQKIAVAHNLDDQAETALFRIIRGSGIEGLSAIYPVVDGLIIRPLIECSRGLILDYLKRHEIAYREDSTNTDLRHSRNRIRREVIPYLEKYLNPQLKRTLAREADQARETWAFLEAQAGKQYQALSRPVDDGISIQIKDLFDLHAALQKQVLRLALKEFQGSLRGISSAHIEDILSLCGNASGSRRIHLPGGIVVLRRPHQLLLLKQMPAEGIPFCHRFPLPGICRVPEAGRIFSATICSTPDPGTIKDMCLSRAYLQQSALPPVLTIRSRIAGDRYGGPGHRKVKKMLIDRKIPSERRSFIPMVAAGDDVIWIPGFRPARAYEARPGSGPCVMIEIKEDAGNAVRDAGGKDQTSK